MRVYDWNDSAWVQVGADIDGEAAYDYSGWSVAFSADGNRLAQFITMEMQVRYVSMAQFGSFFGRWQPPCHRRNL
ncbi:MAG: hypothetical protein R2798_13105 [Chitinophagales bacterium]